MTTPDKRRGGRRGQRALAVTVLAMSLVGGCKADPLVRCGDGYCASNFECQLIDGAERCVAGTCGNGSVEGGEACDFSLPPDACIDFGFDRGATSCSDGCVPLLDDCGYIGWQREGFGPGVENIFGVWGSGGSDVYAVRESFTDGESALLHYDGDAWSSVEIPRVGALLGIWGSGPDDVFAVGTGGIILRYDGERWHERTPMPGLTLTNVWGSGPDGPVFAVSQIGSILGYDRTLDAWEEMPATTNGSLEGLWGYGPDNVIAVGDDAILHYDGTTWSRADVRLPPGIDEPPYWVDVWGTGPSRTFAVGALRGVETGGGVILEYDGTSWTYMNVCEDDEETLEPCTVGNLKDVWGNSASDIYAVGDEGTILHYDGNDEDVWMPLEFEVNLRLESVWASGAGQVWAVGWNGTFLRYGGQAWGVREVHGAPQLSDVWGTDPNNVYAIANGNELYRFDGERFTEQDLGRPGPSTRLRGIFGRSADEIYVVGDVSGAGEDGEMTFARFTGDSWQPMNVDASAPKAHLYDVWASADQHVFAVGRTTDDLTAMILHCDAVTMACAVEAPGGVFADKLHGVWGCSSTDAVAVGERGRIAHYDGQRWITDTLALGDELTLWDVWGSACDDVFAVGDAGTVQHYDGQTWTSMRSGTDEGLRAIWGTARDDVYAVGFTGTILHYDGDRWSPVDSRTDLHLSGVWGTISDSGTTSTFVYTGQFGTYRQLVRSH